MKIVVIGGSGHIGTFLIPAHPRPVRAGQEVVNKSTARSRLSKPLPATSLPWAANWNWSPTLAATSSRCPPTPPPDHRRKSQPQAEPRVT
jgi:hypothetical protein